MDQGLHPIENEDGEVADEVLQALGEAGVNAQGNQGDQPSAAQVFNRIVRFEEILQHAWEEFKDEISGKLDILKGDVNTLHGNVQEIKLELQRGQGELQVSCSVVLLDIQKIGKVKSLTDKFAEVILDEDNRKVKKKKTSLMRIQSIH